MTITSQEIFVQLFRSHPEFAALLLREQGLARVPPMSAPAIDYADPRAPSEEAWSRMTEEERKAWVEALPASVPFELYPPEGDLHSGAKDGIASALSEFYRSVGKRMYISKELATYYPDERVFCPDVLVVSDVETHPREKWVVSHEGKGLDLVIEVYVAGDRKKDFDRNVKRYARLGIREYFAFDRKHMQLSAFRLPESNAGVYVPIVPQAGRYSSQVLQLDLALERERIRFYYGTAPLAEANELIERLERVVNDVTARAEQDAMRAAEALLLAEQRAEREAQRAEREAQRAQELERRLAELEGRARKE